MKHSSRLVCRNDLQGCTTHNQTSTIFLPTQGTCRYCLHTHTCISVVYFMKKKVLSLSVFLMKLRPTVILLKQADLVCDVLLIRSNPSQSRRDTAWNISPASPSLHTWTGSCCLGSSCAASSARPDTSPDSPLYSCVPPGISSRQPAGATKSSHAQLKRPQLKSFWSRLISSRLGGAIFFILDY